jgi:hypothetical protein
MGLRKIVGVRQYTTFTPAGKVIQMYEVKFTTMKTEGEFTLDIPKDEYTAAKAVEMAGTHAKEIDAAVS